MHESQLESDLNLRDECPSIFEIKTKYLFFPLAENDRVQKENAKRWRRDRGAQANQTIIISDSEEE